MKMTLHLVVCDDDGHQETFTDGDHQKAGSPAILMNEVWHCSIQSMLPGSAWSLPLPW